jgi:WD40 repeat protein
LDVVSGSEIAVFNHPDIELSIAFDPNVTRLATGSDNISRLWNLASGEAVADFEGHSDGVVSVPFSKDMMSSSGALLLAQTGDA